MVDGAARHASPRAAAALRTPPVFVISGHGWGHGVGMSQYGAYGYAQHGFTTTRSSRTTTRAPSSDDDGEEHPRAARRTRER